MTSRNSREKKKQAKKQRQEYHRLEAKQRLDRVLSALGALMGFRELPSDVRGRVVYWLPSRPEVGVESAAAGCPDAAALRAEIELALERTGVPMDGGQAVPLSEFFSTCCTLPGDFAALAAGPLRRLDRPFVAAAAASMGAFYAENAELAVTLLSGEAQASLQMRSRPGPAGVRVRPGEAGSPPRKAARAPDDLPQRAEGGSRGDRRAGAAPYQCGTPLGLDGIWWAEADGADFGLPAGGKHRIYIQPHALHRLWERLPLGRYAKEVTQSGLLESLGNLTVVERHGDGFLVEYRLLGLRVGYLIARPAHGKVVVTTFLFLTMQGTPECRLLEERLQLTRRDIQYEGLDRLETFLDHDLHADAGLVELLKECGCGPLLTLGRRFSPSPIFRTPLFEARSRVSVVERQPSGSGANTWANSWAGIGKPNCRRTRACSAVSRVACTTRPRRVRRSISP